MDLFIGILAQAQNGRNDEQMNWFYQNWGCAGVFVPFVVAAGYFLVLMVLNKQKWTSEFKNNLVLAKERVAAVFMDTVIFEAQLLLNLIEDHLPLSITQALKSEPLKTKFDIFCEELVEISNSSNDNSRADISEILEREEIFSGLIVSEAEKLVNIIKLSPRLEHTAYNSTRISYALQGDTALKFSFIADRLFALERIRKKHVFCLEGSLYLMILSILGFSSFLVPLMWDRKFCLLWGYVSLFIFSMSALLCIVLFVSAHKKNGKLIILKEEYESDFESAYEKWKKRSKK